MASPSSFAATPLTFELPRTLGERIQVCRRRHGLKTTSAVVRQALERFDYAGFQAPHREQFQISVRLSPGQKRTLVREARRRRVSAGELLRAALVAFARAPAAAKAAREPGPGAPRR